jgi:hypothetical protein
MIKNGWGRLAGVVGLVGPDRGWTNLLLIASRPAHALRAARCGARVVSGRSGPPPYSNAAVDGDAYARGPGAPKVARAGSTSPSPSPPYARNAVHKVLGLDTHSGTGRTPPATLAKSSSVKSVGLAGMTR